MHNIKSSAKVEGVYLTEHSLEKLRVRRLSRDAVSAVLEYGRAFHVRGADIYAIGRKEVEYFISQGIDLSQFEGVQVVCDKDGRIMTVYRNRDFRGLRPKRLRSQRKRAA